MEKSRRDRARRKLPPVPAVLLGALGALALGTLIGLAADPSPLVGTTGYVVATGLLLAVGLYGSTYGIDLADLRRDLRGVVAAVTLGVVLKAGMISGVMAFAAQAVVAVLLMPLFVRGLSRRDRILLGIGQQNGLTAVLLALTLERDFPKTVGIVAPAVVTVNLLHYGAQIAFGCWSRHRAGKQPRPAVVPKPLPRHPASGARRRRAGRGAGLDRRTAAVRVPAWMRWALTADPVE
ncbi:hypothetical protein [Streptomyces massasporeus]|uniref:hypothetical protein n=1 Tax=Streptomyces massasporeus TaxID=67324 RepID=UPI003828A34A